MNSLQARLQAFQKSLQDNLEKKIQNEKLQDLEQGVTRAAKVVFDIPLNCQDFKNSNSLHKQTVLDFTKVIVFVRYFPILS